jgi:hypothetical protein
MIYPRQAAWGCHEEEFFVSAEGNAEEVVSGRLGLRQLLHELSDALADHLEHATSSAEYYDQDSSPLSAHAHALLVRTGLVPGFKVARRVLVKRRDLHAYIERHKVEPNVASTKPDAEAAA